MDYKLNIKDEIKLVENFVKTYILKYPFNFAYYQKNNKEWIYVTSSLFSFKEEKINISQYISSFLLIEFINSINQIINTVKLKNTNQSLISSEYCLNIYSLIILKFLELIFNNDKFYNKIKILEYIDFIYNIIDNLFSNINDFKAKEQIVKYIKCINNKDVINKVIHVSIECFENLKLFEDPVDRNLQYLLNIKLDANSNVNNLLNNTKWFLFNGYFIKLIKPMSNYLQEINYNFTCSTNTFFNINNILIIVSNEPITYSNYISKHCLIKKLQDSNINLILIVGSTFCSDILNIFEFHDIKLVDYIDWDSYEKIKMILENNNFYIKEFNNKLNNYIYVKNKEIFKPIQLKIYLKNVNYIIFKYIVECKDSYREIYNLNVYLEKYLIINKVCESYGNIISNQIEDLYITNNRMDYVLFSIKDDVSFENNILKYCNIDYKNDATLLVFFKEIILQLISYIINLLNASCFNNSSTYKKTEYSIPYNAILIKNMYILIKYLIKKYYN